MWDEFFETLEQIKKYLMNSYSSKFILQKEDKILGYDKEQVLNKLETLIWIIRNLDLDNQKS